MRLWLTTMLMTFAAMSAAAQWDTTGLRLRSLSLGTTATGLGLMAAGGVATCVPAVNTLAVDLRDDVVAASLSPLRFDDYLQYLPMAAPLTLKLCGLESRHPMGRMALLEGGSYLLGAGWLNALKYSLDITRPDASADNSFPSGHTFVAFTGAELLRREYGADYPWVAVAGYSVAIVVALMRIYNNRHWVGDVLAGAGLGIMSVTLVYWALD